MLTFQVPYMGLSEVEIHDLLQVYILLLILPPCVCPCVHKHLDKLNYTEVEVVVENGFYFILFELSICESCIKK